MNANDLCDAIGSVDEKYIRESMPKKRRRRYAPWITAAAALLVIAIGLGIFFGRGGAPGLFAPAIKSFAVAVPEYPEAAPYPASESDEGAYDRWWKQRRERMQLYGAGSGLSAFFAACGRAVFANRQKNTVFSPLNTAFALSMLAEITGGETRAQLLSLLGEPDLAALRETMRRVWLANYSDDGAVTSIPANSVWMNDAVDFKKETVETLARAYYAGTFSGSFAEKAYVDAMRAWINEQTDDLLADAANGLPVDDMTVLMLISTLYYRAKWGSSFEPSQTAPAAFHTEQGDVTGDFMRRTEDYGRYFWGERFGAVFCSLQEAGEMWFILPDEGVSPEALFDDPQLAALLDAMQHPYDETAWEAQKQLRVNLCIPKFDVSSTLDLRDTLEGLGVTDCFSSRADFSPLTDEAGLAVSSVIHAARTAIDEEGVTAAAFTAIPTCGASLPPAEEMDFTLDRPFLFVITGFDGLPLYMGTVHDPF